MGRPKRVIHLAAAEWVPREAGRHHYPKQPFRARCPCLLWSADGQPVPALLAVLGFGRLTVYAWLTRGETGAGPASRISMPHLDTARLLSRP